MRILTGMQSSGTPHIGNYFGMMRRTIEFQKNRENSCFWFIADLHSHTTVCDPKIQQQNLQQCVLDWLALGIDPEVSTFYRQSDIAGIHTELMWYLSCLAPMGLLERAHGYKDKVARGLDSNTGLFTYPILMAADILLYDAQSVPVGKDQKQHIEIARDLAQKFNTTYGEVFTLPDADIDDDTQVLPGTDGEKMSKSYNNTIDIFANESVFKKSIMSIKTGSEALGEALSPDNCIVFRYHQLFENPELESLRQQYLDGAVGYGESKKQLFQLAWEYFIPFRKKREYFSSHLDEVEEIMQLGAKKAREVATTKIQKVRSLMGIV